MVTPFMPNMYCMPHRSNVSLCGFKLCFAENPVLSCGVSADYQHTIHISIFMPRLACAPELKADCEQWGEEAVNEIHAIEGSTDHWQ